MAASGTTTTTAPFTIPSYTGNVVIQIVGSGSVLPTAGTTFLIIAGALYTIVNNNANPTVTNITGTQGVVVPTGTPVVWGVINPIVANPNTLAAAAACFGNQCLGPDDREALEILAMVYELQADGGKDYRTNLPQLLADAATWTRLDEDTRRAIHLYIQVVDSINAGSGLTTNVNSLRKLANCILCMGWETRRSIKLYLKAVLNQGDFVT